MKHLLITCFTILIFNQIRAQSITHQLIGNGGSNFSTPTLSVSLSIGEPVSFFGSTGAAHISQGYQYGSNSTVLATEIIDFQAVRIIKDSVLLSWHILNNEPLNHFCLQRSVDGKTFLTIQNLSKTALNSSFVDANDMPMPTYYRLNWTENKGKTTYSPIRSVAGLPLKVRLSPNPVSDVLFFSLEQSSKNSLTFQTEIVEIIDTKGQVLLTQNLSNTVFSINVSNLAQGIYFCRFNHSSSLLKFVKN